MGKKLTFVEYFMCKLGWHKWKKDIVPIYANYSSMECGSNWECETCGARGESYHGPMERIETTKPGKRMIKLSPKA